MSEAIDRIQKKLDNKQNYMIMVVGDSVTWGLNHCSDEETYCAVLARLLSKRFPSSRVIRYDGIALGGNMPLSGYSDPVVVQDGQNGTLTIVRSGVGGDSVRRALRRSDDYTGSFVNGESPDLFLLMFGINDALANDSSKYVTAEVFYSDLKELIALIDKLNSPAKMILMTPTYNDSGEKEQSCLDEYSNMVKKIAVEKKLQCIDTHSLWMEHLIIGSENYGQRDWLSGIKGDTCHFSPKAGIATAEYIYSKI